MLLENVKNIISIDNANVIKTIDRKLDETGYFVHRDVLNSSYFGIPQKRERVYFVCFRRDVYDIENIRLKYKKPKETYDKIYLKDILETNVDESLYIDRKDIHIKEKEVIQDLNPIRIGIVNKGGQGERIYSTKGHAVTLSAYGVVVGAKTGLYLVEDRIRRLSINESKRVMGYKDDFKLSNGVTGYRQLGNSVIPSMIEKVWENIKVT